MYGARLVATAFSRSPRNKLNLECNPMTSNKRIVLTLVLGFLSGIVSSLYNGRNLSSVLQAGCIFAVIVTIVVALLSWGMDIAKNKGYPGWVGFVLVFIFNVFGLFILAILPNKAASNNNSGLKQR
jgi:hypothetical protein